MQIPVEDSSKTELHSKAFALSPSPSEKISALGMIRMILINDMTNPTAAIRP